ncbi:hypothetical protein Pint_34607 [Pistacia integerrima]|uniref:Uncharacterized protein n=1 Tax=Pistacia integerrima TaxID=434235 RepID=A0ACC0X5E5_9ROSI|nr:hypothetical protein Pint_34607 [Pistacia integerrima]
MSPSPQNLIVMSAMNYEANTQSRSHMDETTDGGLYEIFQQNFSISSAGYAVASLLSFNTTQG